MPQELVCDPKEQPRFMARQVVIQILTRTALAEIRLSNLLDIHPLQHSCDARPTSPIRRRAPCIIYPQSQDMIGTERLASGMAHSRTSSHPSETSEKPMSAEYTAWWSLGSERLC